MLHRPDTRKFKAGGRESRIVKMQTHSPEQRPDWATHMPKAVGASHQVASSLLKKSGVEN